MICSPCAIQIPGAVPLGFGSAFPPAGTSACLRLPSGMCNRRCSKRRRIAASTDASLTSARPSTTATASRVRSSAVGPSPPVEITTSARESAVLNAPASASGSSPTTPLKRTSIPSAFSLSVRCSELVSMRCGVSNSLPTARISAVVTGRISPWTLEPPGEQQNRASQQKVRVHRGHQIIGHDAEATVQGFELPRRPRLDDIEQPEQEKPQQDAWPANGQARERQELPGDLVDDDVRRIALAEMPCGRIGGPDARERNCQKQEEL